MLPIFLEPVRISQKITISGKPPHHVTVTVKYSKHETRPFGQWKVMYSEEFVLENNELLIDLVTIDEFDVWYLEIFVRVENKIGSTDWRSGVFGLFLGGYPPRLWRTKVDFSPDSFLGIVPMNNSVRMGLGAVTIGVIPENVRTKITTVGIRGQKPLNQGVTIDIS